MPTTDAASSRGSGWSRVRPRTLTRATLMAIGVALLAAVAWALLRGIFELGPGLLALAAVAGWAIGALLFQVRGPALLAVGIAVLAWIGGLVGTWLVSMAILPGSSRTFLERVEATPFPEWMQPQLGLLEIGGLLLFVLAAGYGARSR